MRYRFAVVALACAVLAACSSPVAQFWRPISEPNVLLPSDQLQRKLDFDLSQCHCGIYPTNSTRDEAMAFQADKQRLIATGVTVMPEENGQCSQKPSLIVSECMRQRGWEPTTCSGRMAVPNGGSLCATYVPAE